MVGLVIATHGHLAEELLSTAEQIVGRLAGVATCVVQPGDGPEVIQNRLVAAISAVDSGDGVLVLADLFGGSPCNQALQASRSRSLEVLTGVNLPMVLKANSLRAEAMPLPELAQTLAVYAQRNITLATALVREAVSGQRSH